MKDIISKIKEKQELLVILGISVVLVTVAMFIVWIAFGLVGVVLLGANSLIGTSTCEVFTWERIAKCFTDDRTMPIIAIITYTGVICSVLYEYGGYKEQIDLRVKPFISSIKAYCARQRVKVVLKVLQIVFIALLVLFWAVVIYGYIRGNLC